MTTEFLLRYIPTRMQTWELPDYGIVHRSVVVAPFGTREQFFDGVYTWFPSELIPASTEILSDCGVMSKSGAHPVITYEHTGRTLMINQSAQAVVFHFLMAVPGPVNPSTFETES